MQLEAYAQTALGDAVRQIYTAHHGDPNFTGCGIGFRRRAGRQTDEPVAIAMVVNKRPEAIVSQRRLLPKAVDVEDRRWGVDVVEVGPITFSGATTAATGAVPSLLPGPKGIFRPPVQGCSISNINPGPTGTLGCLVRDLSDGTVCILSTNHVLARVNQAVSGELIIQPGAVDTGTQVDGIAALKRFARLVDGTNVDAAIAQLNDQTHISQAVADGLMAPISPSHPAVGMVVADDSGSCGHNCFLSRMDTTLNALNIKLLGATSTASAAVAPQIGMHIEKVGRVSGYTSSTIAAIGTIVKVNFPPLGQFSFKDLIWTQALHVLGESGAVACQGGDGHSFSPSICDSGACVLFAALATYYDIPVNSVEDNALADELQERFLSQSTTGQLIIGMTYLNAQMIINRLKAQTGSAHNQATAQAHAQTLYSQYHDLAARLITSSSPTDVVTSSDLHTVQSILRGLTFPTTVGGTAMTSGYEGAAAWALYQDILVPTVGMNRQQLIDYMNTSAVFQEVQAKIRTVPTLTITGSVV